jgi:hypothetical protein
MKALVDVAVFGLMAVPVIYTRSSSGDRRTTSEEMTTSQRASFDITERMATKDELARIYYELERKNAELTARSMPTP